MDLIDREQLMNYIRSNKINIGQVAHIIIMKQESVNAVSEEVYTREYNLRKDAEMKVYKLEKALEQEPTKREIEREYLFQSLCEDFKKLQAENDDLRKRLEKEPKEGHWKIIPFGNNHGEYRPNVYECSECGWKIDLCRGLQQDTGHRLFCEHCGAKMVEP